MRQRLHKFIAATGRASRRGAERLIEEGRVRVNGNVIDGPGTSVDPAEDRVEVDGVVLSLPERATVVLNKPKGVITTTSDTHGRPTVLDLLPAELTERGVLPAGRLDQDTEGLLVLTNDGALIQRLTHPSHETEKEYLVTLYTVPPPQALDRLARGVLIDDRRTAPATLTRMEPDENGRPRVRVVLHEGRKRQVRRMFDAVRHPVAELRRVRVGTLELGDLPAGAWRRLSDDEVASLEEPR